MCTRWLSILSNTAQQIKQMHGLLKPYVFILVTKSKIVWLYDVYCLDSSLYHLCFPIRYFFISTEKNEHSCLRHGKLIRTLPLYGTKITASLSPNISFTLLLISFFLTSTRSCQFSWQLSPMCGGTYTSNLLLLGK